MSRQTRDRLQTFDCLIVSGAQLRRQAQPRVAVRVEFLFAAAYRAPVRLWLSGPWCLDRPANANQPIASRPGPPLP